MGTSTSQCWLLVDISSQQVFCTDGTLSFTPVICFTRVSATGDGLCLMGGLLFSPRQEGLVHSGSHFTLEMPFGSPFPSVWVEDLTVKVSATIWPCKSYLTYLRIFRCVCEISTGRRTLYNCPARPILHMYYSKLQGTTRYIWTAVNSRRARSSIFLCGYSRTHQMWLR